MGGASGKGGRIMGKMGVSPITNKIYYGNVNKAQTMWVGEKKDVTDMAVMNVFEWFMNQMKSNQEFEIRYPDVKGYVLKMVKEDVVEE